MYPSRFRYEAAHSLDQATRLLRDGGDEAKVLAGGQSLIPMMKLRFASPELLSTSTRSRAWTITGSTRTAASTSAPCAGTPTWSTPNCSPAVSRRWRRPRR